MLSTAKPASSPCELDRLRDQIAAARREFAQTGGKVQKLDWAGQPVGEYVDVPVVPVVAAVPKPAPDPAKASLAAALAAVAAPAKPEPTGCLQVEIVKAKPVETEKPKVKNMAELVDSLDVIWQRRRDRIFFATLRSMDRRIAVVRQQLLDLKRDLRRSAGHE